MCRSAWRRWRSRAISAGSSCRPPAARRPACWPSRTARRGKPCSFQRWANRPGLVLSVAARSALILAVAYAALPWLGRTSAAGYAAIGLGRLCPRCPQHAGISKQAAVFCKKARKKLHSPGTAGRAERAESPTPKVLRAVAKSLARSAAPWGLETLPSPPDRRFQATEVFLCAFFQISAACLLIPAY